MPKLIVKTQPGTPVSCIPMQYPDNYCIGMIFKTPHRTFVLGGFEADHYMRSDGWSGEGHDPVAMLENDCVSEDGPIRIMTDEMTIEQVPAYDSYFGFETPTYEVTFTNKLKLIFSTYNEV